jgi:RNA polymerase sigma-70 factor (ECF subfamily)
LLPVLPLSEKYHADLLARIAEGDEKAFNELFGIYRNRLYAYLIKITKSKETAEEATLDVFLKIWNARHILKEINNFETFIFRVVHNKAIDYLRIAKRSRLQQQEIWLDIEALVLAEGADERILKSETETAINRAIRQLSPQRQEAFRLSREEFLNYDQIAEKMNLSRNTIKNHVSAALSFIRGHIDDGVDIASVIMLTANLG